MKSLRLFTAFLFCLSLLFTTAPTAWAEDAWSDPHPGVRLLRRSTSRPWQIRVVTVDLCARGISLRATREGERQQRTSTFARSVGAQVAINGDFFTYDGYWPLGMAIGAGEHWRNDDGTKGFVTFGDDHALITPGEENWSEPAFWMDEAVGGYPLVTGGARHPTLSPSHCSERHPRSAVGLSWDRQQLILAVVDGRSSASVGMTCAELADLMIEMGAETALNLDGGGSTALYVEGAGGIVNRPSDGSERVVANHLAVYASGSGAPESCDFWVNDVIYNAAVLDTGHTDVDGDGRADLCARAAAGFFCRPAETLGFPEPGDAWWIDLTDDGGWGDPTNYSTLRMGDIDGDGLVDLCARGNTLVRCWRSDGAGWEDLGARASFSDGVEGPGLSDEWGWGQPRYASTIRLADVNGDGLDDLCARAAAGLRCYPSHGDGFDASLSTELLTNEGGWGFPEHFGTVRFGDINGDGMEDACARGNAGMFCWLARPDGQFEPTVEGPAWSDEAGWDRVECWGTIRLVDLDGDGLADLCGRGPNGIRCHLSTGDGFGPEIVGPELSDAVGWSDHSNASTVRFADIDGDGDADLCARANRGIWCWFFEGGGFGDRFEGPAWSDEDGWDEPRQYTTIRFADIDGDGDADVCGRGADGIECWLSDGFGFPEYVEGPRFSDAVGWGGLRYYSTIRLAGPPPLEGEDAGPGDGGPGDGGPSDSGPDDGGPDDSGPSDAGPGDGGDDDGGSSSDADGVDDGGTTGGDPEERSIEGGCSCRAGGLDGRAGGRAGTGSLARFFVEGFSAGW